MEGLSFPPGSPVTTKAAGQNGYSLHRLQYDERIIRLSGHVHGKSGVDAMYKERRRLNSVLNPALGAGLLEYENDFGKWQIKAFARSMPYAQKMGGVQSLNIEFECPMPFWSAAEQKEARLSYMDGGLEFPIETPNIFGTMGYAAELNLDCDVFTPVEMFIEGGAKKPVITNMRSGERIEIGCEIPAYSTIYINTDPEKSEVKIITPMGAEETKTENAYGYLSPDSSLFGLLPGNNELVYLSEDNTQRTRIRILFRERYIGV